MKRKKLTCEEARNYCIVKILANIGHTPARRTETDAWYLSPLRSETHPSFHVSVVKNRWYDHGLGKGGNIIDLVMAMNRSTVKEALDFLSQDEYPFSFQQQEKFFFPETKIKVIKVVTISHPALIEYLKERCIPLEVARKFCKEVWYSLKGKIYFAIGLQNQLGGWELRNKYYKNSTSPKSYSILYRSSSTLLITEGMFDFLSLAVLEKELVEFSDCIILNSLNFLKQVEIMFSSYRKINLFLDNDLAGNKASADVTRNYKDVFIYKSILKDLNESLKSGWASN